MTLDAAQRDLQTVLRECDGMADATVGRLVPFGDGNSGFTYSVDLDAGGKRSQCVLRLSPPNTRIAGPADVGRQGRIMAALRHVGAPVPRIIAWDSAPTVDGRAFVLMDIVRGGGWDSTQAPPSHDELAATVVSTLKRLQSTERSATGVGTEPAVTPAAELERWAHLLGRAVEPVRGPGMNLAELLGETTPPASSPCLVHGDFHYGNLLFRDGEVVAVLDWEIAQYGEPLLDLGCLAIASLRRKYRPEPNPTGGVDVSLTRLLEIYGADPEDAAWFVGLSCLKYGAILGYNLELHRRGKRHAPVYEALHQTMRGLMHDGITAMQAGHVDAELASARC